MSASQHFPENNEGRDFVVGDIHGEFAMLAEALFKVGFNTKTDRLFSVGDLIDRGPLSEMASRFLAEPWFHPVRGNHEDLMIWAMDDIRYGDTNTRACHMYRMNGGEWLFNQKAVLQDTVYTLLNTLPYSIAVAIADGGRVGIVHAEPCSSDWGRHEQKLLDLDHAQAARHTVSWCRERFMNHANLPAITGVEHVFVGHCPAPEVRRHQNVINIDTHAYSLCGTLTLCHLATGEIATQITKE